MPACGTHTKTVNDKNHWTKMFRTERYKPKSTVVRKINTLEEDDNFDIVYTR